MGKIYYVVLEMTYEILKKIARFAPGIDDSRPQAAETS